MHHIGSQEIKVVTKLGELEEAVVQEATAYLITALSTNKSKFLIGKQIILKRHAKN